jgi:hypothetical protein
MDQRPGAREAVTVSGQVLWVILGAFGIALLIEQLLPQYS